MKIYRDNFTQASLSGSGDLLLQLHTALEMSEQPFVYRGFQMINQEKLREMRGDVLRGWAQSGLLPLLYAHLFSLELVSQIFGTQVQQGKGPIPAIPVPATVDTSPKVEIFRIL